MSHFNTLRVRVLEPRPATRPRTMGTHLAHGLTKARRTQLPIPSLPDTLPTPTTPLILAAQIDFPTHSPPAKPTKSTMKCLRHFLRSGIDRGSSLDLEFLFIEFLHQEFWEEFQEPGTYKHAGPPSPTSKIPPAPTMQHTAQETGELRTLRAYVIPTHGVPGFRLTSFPVLGGSPLSLEWREVGRHPPFSIHIMTVKFNNASNTLTRTVIFQLSQSVPRRLVNLRASNRARLVKYAAAVEHTLKMDEEPQHCDNLYRVLTRDGTLLAKAGWPPVFTPPFNAQSRPLSM
ncbi:hypothetical protein C8R46DRAFT_1027884 [Mycena filopes]|nr:hypothetical protein C8R46DRAFT_1027884 [Mycena filopes]